MPTEAEQQEIAAEVAAEEGVDQPSTGHPVGGDDLPRGNVHGEVSDGDEPGDLPAPLAH